MAVMPETRPPLDVTALSLSQIAAALAERRLPPVEQWQPASCGISGMRIARDGSWFHDGEPIRREAMVRLFSTVLRREPDGSFVLVTPVEKLIIEVDLAPFVATAMRADGDGKTRQIAFSLNSGDAVLLGPEHGLRIDADGVPLLHVRGGLEASLARPVYYELAELALEDGPEGLWSGGERFVLEAR
jgi:uncharacterized protein